jgi:hypothetical protein
MRRAINVSLVRICGAERNLIEERSVAGTGIAKARGRLGAPREVWVKRY